MTQDNTDVKGLQSFRVPQHGSCEGCGIEIRSEAYKVPGLAGLFDTLICIETALFGGSRCRWCAVETDRPYTSIESRLCSDDCRANYFAHVLGDRTARLGSGKRFLLWLQHKQPAIYRQLMTAGVADRSRQNTSRRVRRQRKARDLAHATGVVKPVGAFSRAKSGGEAFLLNPSKQAVSQGASKA